MSFHLFRDVLDPAYALNKRVKEDTMNQHSQAILAKTFGDTCLGQKLAANRPHAKIIVRESALCEKTPVKRKRLGGRLSFRTGPKTAEDILLEEGYDDVR